MAILVESGRIAVAIAIRSQAIHLAWGSGDSAWDAVPAPGQQPLVSETGLKNEVGRLLVTSPMFVEPNASGSISVANGRFEASPNDAPTKYLYLRFAFDQTDAASETIRELGIFVGGTTVATPVSGRKYYNTSEVLTPGRLLVLEYIDKLVRSASVKQQFEFVIQF